jgi:hypothetical protein
MIITLDDKVYGLSSDWEFGDKILVDAANPTAYADGFPVDLYVTFSSMINIFFVGVRNNTDEPMTLFLTGHSQIGADGSSNISFARSSVQLAAGESLNVMVALVMYMLSSSTGVRIVDTNNQTVYEEGVILSRDTASSPVYCQFYGRQIG